VEEPAPTRPATPAAAVTTTPEIGKLPAIESGPAESHSHVWLWTIIAVVVAGGAAAAGYYFLRPADAPPPMTQLGNFRY
jgi:hypothetical protein